MAHIHQRECRPDVARRSLAILAPIEDRHPRPRCHQFPRGGKAESRRPTGDDGAHAREIHVVCLSPNWAISWTAEGGRLEPLPGFEGVAEKTDGVMAIAEHTAPDQPRQPAEARTP